MVNTQFMLTDSVNNLGGAIKEHSMSLNVTFNTGSRINMPANSSVIIYLESGFAGLYREHDDSLISEINGPWVFGLNHLFFDNHCFYLKFNAEGRLYYIGQKEFITICDKKNLWRNVSHVLANAEQKKYSNKRLSSFRCAYDIIKFYLESIWSLPEQERDKVSIYKYILGRSSLSRSSLQKIIHELNVGGYIKTDRGRLVDVVQLPVKY